MGLLCPLLMVVLGMCAYGIFSSRCSQFNKLSSTPSPFSRCNPFSKPNL